MDTIEKRVSDRAYYLWLDEGRPHGRHWEHWQLARSLLGLESGDGAQRLPPPLPEHQDQSRASAGDDPSPAEAQQRLPGRPKPAKQKSSKMSGKAGAAKKSSDPNRKEKPKQGVP